MTREQMTLYQRQYRQLMKEREKRVKALKVSAPLFEQKQKPPPKFCDRCQRQLGTVIYVLRKPNRFYHRECFS